MSSPPGDLPSRPERARVERSGKSAEGTTGFQPVLHSGRKKSEKRRRQRAMHEDVLKPSLLKPSKLPEDPIFTYFQEETEKKDGASCVFLLWGSENSESFTTWAVDVPITDVENEHEIFDSLAKKYDKELGFLRRCLSFRKFSRLKPVTVRSHHLIACPSVLKLSIVPIDLPFLKQILSLR
jgi:hypothetical protein